MSKHAVPLNAIEVRGGRTVEQRSMLRLIGKVVGVTCVFLSVVIRIGNGAELSDEHVKTKLTELVQDYLDFESKFAHSLPEKTGALAETDDQLSDEAWLMNWKNEGVGGPDERFLPRFINLAERNPHSSYALDALTYVINRNNATIGVEGAAWRAKEKAIDLVSAHHLDDPRIALVCEFLIRSLPSEKTKAFLRKASTENPNRATRAAASFALAGYYQNLIRLHTLSRHIKSRPRITNHERSLKLLMTPYLEAEYPCDRDEVSKEVTRILERVAKEYSGIPVTKWKRQGPGGTLFKMDVKASAKTYGELAQAMLLEINKLLPGTEAPEIEGVDADGKSFRLSSFRGKVVMLTFSANWCGPCRSVYPLHRNLVDRFKGQPFVLLSVNMDDKVDTLKSSLEKGDITWRCWWDGVNGPIYSSWNSPGTPAMFLLDDTGVIQDVKLDRASLESEYERAIEDVLRNVSNRKTSEIRGH